MFANKAGLCCNPLHPKSVPAPDTLVPRICSHFQGLCDKNPFRLSSMPKSEMSAAKFLALLIVRPKLLMQVKMGQIERLLRSLIKLQSIN